MASNLNGRALINRGGAPPGRPPPNGKGPPSHNEPLKEVKKEKTEAEKLYMMTETADTLKLSHPGIFPISRPQKPTRFNAMFAPPPGVTPVKRTSASVKNIITDSDSIEIVSRSGDGPSAAIEQMFFTRNCSPNTVAEIKNKHFLYALQNLYFIRVNNCPVLIFQTTHLLNYNMNDGLNKYLVSCRTRWFAANLIRLPTSPQVIAAQLLRNHGRIYSETSLPDNPVAYQKEVQRLLRVCPGLDKALIPSPNQPVGGLICMHWCRMRRRVLESMLEAVNNLANANPANLRNFFAAMPFNIKNVADLLTSIREQIEECAQIWKREEDKDIVLSDGPIADEEEDMEDDYSMGGHMQNEQRNGTHQMHHTHPPQLGARPVHTTLLTQYPSSSSTMPSLNDYYHMSQQRTAVPGPSHNVSRQGMGVNGRGMGRVMAPPRDIAGTSRTITTNSYNGVQNTLQRRNDQQRYGMKPPLPSAARSSIQTQQDRRMVHQNPTLSTTNPSVQPFPQPPSPTQTEYMEEMCNEMQEEQHQQQVVVPPPSNQLTQSPAPLSITPSTQSTSTLSIQQTPRVQDRQRSGLIQSPFLLPSNSPSSHLFVVGPDGVPIVLPTVVYVQQTEDGGLVQVQSPNPAPQIILSMGSSERGRRMERSNSRRKRQGSRDNREDERLKRRRRSGWRRESDDGSSEDDTDYERIPRKNDRRDDKEESEKKEKEKEANKKKEELMRNEEVERLRLEEENKKKEEEERIQREEDDRKKKEDEERIEIVRRRMEEEEKEKRDRERIAEVIKAAELENIRIDDEERQKLEINEEEAFKKREKEIRMEENEYEEEEGDREMREEDEEVVTVLAEDSGDDNEEEDNDKEKERDGEENGEEEVVAESVIDGSDNEDENREKEMRKKTPPSTPSVNTPPTNDDSDVEVLFDGPGEKRNMSIGYCEVVSQSINMKKESNQSGGNEVIYLHQRRSNKRPSQSTKESEKREVIILKGGIFNDGNENRGNTMNIPMEGVSSNMLSHQLVTPINMKSNSNEKRDNIKTEIMEKSEDGSRTDGESIATHTGMSHVKREVKDEEESEKEDDEIEVTMIERKKEGKNMLNQSGELFEEDNEEGNEDRMRNVIEAIAQEVSTQPAINAADSMATVSSNVSTVPTRSSLPIVLIPQEETQENPMPIFTVISDTPTRPMPIRISSLPSIRENGNGGDRMPLLEKRLSQDMISILERSDSLLIPYRGLIDGMEERERGKDKEKEKEKEIEVTKELPLTEEGDTNALRFHIMRGEAAILSDNRRQAIRDESIDSHSKALVFTNRPLFKGEKVTLKVIEISPDWKGRVRLGLTTKNPQEYTSREAIPKQLKADTGDGHITYMYDSGVRNTVNMNTVVGVELTERGDQLTYSFDGIEMGPLGGGLQTGRPMWLSVDIYGFVKGIEIVDSIFPPQPTHGIELPSIEKNIVGIIQESREVKKEVKEEVLSPVKNRRVEEEEVFTLPLIPSIHEKELGNALPMDIVTIDSTVNTVDLSEENGEVQVTVATLKDVLDRVLASEEEEEEDMIVETVMEEEEEEVAIDGDTMNEDEEEEAEVEEEEEEEGQPPVKKMRMNEETSEVIVETEVREEEKQRVDIVEEENNDTEKKDEERIELNEDGHREENGMIGVEEEIEKMDEGQKSIIDVNSTEEKEMVGIEEEAMMEEEKEVNESDGTGMDNDNEEVASELTEDMQEVLKERDAIEDEDDRVMESSDEMSVSVRDMSREESIDNEDEEKKEMEMITDAELTEQEEELEMKEMSPSSPSPPLSSPPSSPLRLPSRRRSLFGPGCFTFDQTLDAKENNEEKMEVDDEEKNEKVYSSSLSRPSLFGPGSASIQNIINNINKSL